MTVPETGGDGCPARYQPRCRRAASALPASPSVDAAAAAASAAPIATTTGRVGVIRMERIHIMDQFKIDITHIREGCRTDDMICIYHCSKQSLKFATLVVLCLIVCDGGCRASLACYHYTSALT